MANENLTIGTILGEQTRRGLVQWKVTGFTNVFGIRHFEIYRYSQKSGSTFGRSREYPLRAASNYLLLS